MNFPGHNYLGPGNPVENGEPVDTDDAIARIHDIAYENARSDSDIRSADRSAIGAFTKDFLLHNNYHSAIGAVGLSGKYLFESVFGIQYPTSYKSDNIEIQNDSETGTVEMSGSRTAPGTSHEDDEPHPKRHRKDVKEMDISESAKIESDNKSIHSNAHAGGHGINIHHPLQTFKKGKLVFMHQRLLFSKGYQFKCIQVNDSELSLSKNIVTTPLALIPCHVLPWYMTESEFKNLPLNASVKLCKTIVSPLGFRTPFQTNNSGTANVNSNLFVMGIHAHGINNQLHGVNMSYTANAESPCVPTGVSFVNKDDGNHWWGQVCSKDGESLDFDNIPCCFMNMHPLQDYYCHAYQAKQMAPTCPDLMKYVHIFNMENGMNNPTIQWEYKPQLCILNSQNPIPPAQGTGTSINFGVKPIGFGRGFVTQDTSYGTVYVNKMDSTSITSVDVPYASYIEHSGSRAHGFSEFGGGLQPPSLHVGVLPIHSYSTTPKDDDIQDVTAIYKFDTYIEIEYSYDFGYPFSNYGNAHSLCTGDLNFIKQDKHHNFAYGYKSWLRNSTTGIPADKQAQQLTTEGVPTTTVLPTTNKPTTSRPKKTKIKDGSPQNVKIPKLQDIITTTTEKSFFRNQLECDDEIFETLTESMFKVLTYTEKSQFIANNFGDIPIIFYDKIIKEYRLFKYIYDGCSKDKERNIAYGNMIVNEILKDQKEKN